MTGQRPLRVQVVGSKMVGGGVKLSEDEVSIAPLAMVSTDKLYVSRARTQGSWSPRWTFLARRGTVTAAV